MAELEEKVGGDGLPAVEEALAGWLRLIHTATKAKISFVKPIRSTGIGASVAHRDPCNGTASWQLCTHLLGSIHRP